MELAYVCSLDGVVKHPFVEHLFWTSHVNITEQQWRAAANQTAQTFF
jgi:hypothetical protein